MPQTKGLNEGRHLGFVAQEVEKVLPNIVKKDHQGIRSVNYEAIIPVLVEAVKEQKNKIQ